ncbi:MAG TPA: ribosome biogenesis GTPase Der [Candidatus Dormibacteraeota bacterium]|nr:ribosome biogenesis GTPase Der [Candidatus Dormibacteraeota bacterium]
MARPIVALIGRPNTGKSTLFNRLIGWRKAIVDRQPGLTRDRLYGVSEWRGREMTVVDTAGLDLDPDDASKAAIERQTRVAIEEAQVIVFLLDAREGVTGIDQDIARMLRRSGRAVVVAANKVDDPRQAYLRHEVLELGFRDPVVISGHHGIGVDDLLDAVLAQLPPPEAEAQAGEEAAARLAIMGRPNVGKSSLLNQLLGDERSLVSATPGTTRDPVDTELMFDGLPVVLVDTAGIRRRSAARDRLEHFSLLRGIRAMERADAVVLVLDGTTGVLAQDQHVASYALEAGKGLVLAVNKIDLVDPAQRRVADWEKQLRGEFRFVRHAPVVTISALTGQGVSRVLPTALEVVGQRRTRIPTNELNRMLREVFLQRPPPSYKGKRLSLKYATQAASDTPTIVLFVNDVNLLHFGYRRYLENQLRERYGFAGNPLRIVLRPASERQRGG